jgi:hypothetical protein
LHFIVKSRSGRYGTSQIHTVLILYCGYEWNDPGAASPEEARPLDQLLCFHKRRLDGLLPSFDIVYMAASIHTEKRERERERERWHMQV